MEIRAAELPADAKAIRSVDTSFTTSSVFDVSVEGLTIRLEERDVDPPITKRFPHEDLEADRTWDRGWLALEAETPIGFAATRDEPWNGRVVVSHLYVTGRFRHGGVGRALLDVALASAAARGARRAWLETSSLNVPGFRAYERLGFDLCGLDLNLYDGTPAEGEVALFLDRSLRA